MRATAPDRLLTGASQTIGKRLVAVPVGAGVPPAFMPKHNCRDIGNRDQIADDVARLDIGEYEGRGRRTV